MKQSSGIFPNNIYPLIDIHCHQSPSAEHLSIVSQDTLLLANAADGTHANIRTEISHNTDFVAIGIHPWYIERLNLTQALHTLKRLATDPTVVAIGECGLDRAITTSLVEQIEVFSWHIELSEQLRKPLIVHCVRAFGELLQLKKRFAPIQAWVIHGFTGKPELAQQLLHHGCFLSFGKALLHNRYAQLSLAATPNEQLFLETDAALDISISEIYSAAAKILKLDIPTLQRQIVANFDRVFTHD